MHLPTVGPHNIKNTSYHMHKWGYDICPILIGEYCNWKGGVWNISIWVWLFMYSETRSIFVRVENDDARKRET